MDKSFDLDWYQIPFSFCDFHGAGDGGLLSAEAEVVTHHTSEPVRDRRESDLTADGGHDGYEVRHLRIPDPAVGVSPWSEWEEVPADEWWAAQRALSNEERQAAFQLFLQATNEGNLVQHQQAEMLCSTASPDLEGNVDESL